MLQLNFIKNGNPSTHTRPRRFNWVSLSAFYYLGAFLIIVGIIIIVAAIIAASARGSRKSGGERRVKAAGVIMIGPIPIIFGTDKKSVKAVLALALALVVAAVVAMIVFYWLLR